MLFRLVKAIIHFTLLTSSSVLGFQTQVIMINEFAGNETSPPPFPGCGNPASNQWCNLVWAVNRSQTPLDEKKLQECFLDQKCCPHPDSSTNFSPCPKYDIFLIIEGVISFLGLVMAAAGGNHGNRKFLRLVGSILTLGGMGALFGTEISASSADPSTNSIGYTSIGGVFGGIIGAGIWYAGCRRPPAVVAPAPALPPAHIALAFVAVAPQPPPPAPPAHRH
jgi:hypothetical protein